MIVLSRQGHGKVERIEALRFTPDGRSLVTPLGRELHVWEGLPIPKKPRIVPDLAGEGPGGPAHVLFTPDGHTALLNSKPLAIYDPSTGTTQQVKLWATDQNENRCDFALTPNGEHFVVTQRHYGSPAGWVSCRPVRNPDADHALWYRELPNAIYHYPTFLSAERFFVRVAPPLLFPSRRKVKPRGAICSAETGQVLSEWENPHLGLWRLNVSPNGELLAGVKCTRIVVFSVANFATPLVTVKNANNKDFTDIAFHPSGGFLATTSNDATVKLYDTTTWEVAHTFTWNIGRMRSVTFSPDGTLAAAGSDTGKIVVWDVDL